MPAFNSTMAKTTILLDIFKVLCKEKLKLYHLEFQPIPLIQCQDWNCRGKYIHCWSNYTEGVKMLLWRSAPITERLTTSLIHAICIDGKYTVHGVKQGRSILFTNINKLLKLSYPTCFRPSVLCLQPTWRVAM